MTSRKPLITIWWIIDSVFLLFTVMNEVLPHEMIAEILVYSTTGYAHRMIVPAVCRLWRDITQSEWMQGLYTKQDIEWLHKWEKRSRTIMRPKSFKTYLRCFKGDKYLVAMELSVCSYLPDRKSVSECEGMVLWKNEIILIIWGCLGNHMKRSHHGAMNFHLTARKIDRCCDRCRARFDHVCASTDLMHQRFLLEKAFGLSRKRKRRK